MLSIRTLQQLRSTSLRYARGGARPLPLRGFRRVAGGDGIDGGSVGDLGDLFLGRRVEHIDPAVLRPLPPLATDQQFSTHAANCTPPPVGHGSDSLGATAMARP